MTDDEEIGNAAAGPRPIRRWSPSALVGRGLWLGPHLDRRRSTADRRAAPASTANATA
jgi:hypothetical protein